MTRRVRIQDQGYDLRHIARVESGSPATGSKAIHDQDLQNTEALVRLEASVGASVVAVRLCAPASTVEARLRQRHQGAELDGLAWHIDRAPELVAIQDCGLQLPVVDASGSPSGIVSVLGLLT